MEPQVVPLCVCKRITPQHLPAAGISPPPLCFPSGSETTGPSDTGSGRLIHGGSLPAMWAISDGLKLSATGDGSPSPALAAVSFA